MYSEMAAFCIITRICANSPYQSRPALRPTQPPVQWEPGLFPPYNGNRVSFPGVKRPGRGVDNPPTHLRPAPRLKKE